MKCPFCGRLDNKVIDSRLSRDSAAIRRRRECLVCERRFTTYEKVEDHIPMLIKRDGRREPYSREKLNRGIMTATQKRPVPIADIQAFIDRLERRLQESSYHEVHTTQIGEEVENFLKVADPVAYVRFASVYRQFKTLQDFERQLQGFNYESEGGESFSAPSDSDMSGAAGSPRLKQ
ncbi:MAG: transcriptional regulator NrdR [Deltaproteobacteria bacterium]|jgi:transcriptional repressor NrdR|nr:transcriptional regulator NrdR [Deltaproteobacteria bacterium]